MAYVFTDKVPGPKGMPYGSSGQVFALIDDERGILAAWLMMKRGLRIRPIGEPGVLEQYAYGYVMKPESSHNPKAPVVVGDSVRSISAVDSVLVLRPLVGMSGEQVSKRLKYIYNNAKG